MAMEERERRKAKQNKKKQKSQRRKYHNPYTREYSQPTYWRILKNTQFIKRQSLFLFVLQFWQIKKKGLLLYKKNGWSTFKVHNAKETQKGKNFRIHLQHEYNDEGLIRFT